MQSVSASYFKTIKQLICCDNHTVICVIQTTSISSVLEWRYFINICCHGYQIIESFRLPFVFSRRAFATIWTLPRLFYHVYCHRNASCLWSRSWWSAAEPLFCCIWEDRVIIFWPWPLPVALVVSRCTPLYTSPNISFYEGLRNFQGLRARGGTQLWVGYGCAARSFDHHPITKPEKTQICYLYKNHSFLEGPFLKPISAFCNVNWDA